MRTGILAVVIPLLAAAAAACSGSERGGAGAADLAPADPARALAARDSAARALVLGWMARRDRTLIGGEDRDFDPRNVQLERDTSRAVPGLAYWWGFYAPPGTADAWVEVAAARGPIGARLLERPADWAAAARAAGWRPSTAAAALAGCVEAVETTGARSSLRWRPVAYLGPASLDHDQIFPPVAADLRASGRLFSPRVAGDSARGFRAEFWAVEARQTTRYACDAGPAERFALAATDSVPYVGLFTPGP